MSSGTTVWEQWPEWASEILVHTYQTVWCNIP